MASCSDSTDYFVSKDIDHDEWAEVDSVFFPICIVENPDVLNPVKYGYDYNLTLSGRFAYDYPYKSLPVVVGMQQYDDSLGWKDLSSPFKLTIPIVDNEGTLEGGGWGSLYKKELLVSGRKMNFPGPGDYRIVLFPDTLLSGVVSMTVELD